MKQSFFINKMKKICHLGSVTMLLSSALWVSGAAQAEVSQQTLPKTLKVCAAANEMPYSNAQQEGFENHIARVVASTMDMPLEFVWSDRAAIFLVTEHLLKNECDVVMGVDYDDPRVATSVPYYKSGYAFIYRSDLDVEVSDWNSADLSNMQRFVIVPGSPSELMLREIGKYEGNFNYTKSLANFKSPRNKYIRLEPSHLINQVANGKGDIAHLWAPEVARYVNNSSVPLTMVMSEEAGKLSNGEEVLQHYAQSVAVRPDDTLLLKAINRALTNSATQITAILKEEGVPLL